MKKNGKTKRRLTYVMPALLLMLLCTSCGEEGLAIRTYSSDETGTAQQDGTGQKDEAGTVQRDDAGSEAEETETCVVYVCGAVAKEGVYTLRSDSRVCDAVDAAGGFTEEAAGHAVNLARPVSDGEQIYIPTEAEAEAGTFSEGTGSSEEKETGTDTRVNINTAGKDELTTLTGIGPGRAADIITYRDRNGRFEKPEDLMQVPGIKEGTYNKLKDQIRVD